MRRILTMLIALTLLLLTGCTQQVINSGTAGPTQPTWSTEPTQGAKTGISDLTVGGYSLSFRQDTQAYEIHIPAGRPRVPKISAVAVQGAEITVTQAVLADGATSGTATVEVRGEGILAQDYYVTFIRDESLGFHLQYDDYYTWDVEAAVYESSAPEIISVSKSGELHAAMLSDQPVTVKALAADGTVIDTLTVDKVVKAPLNIFLITGQSNAYGTYDVPAGSNYAVYSAQQLQLVLKPEPGTVLCTDVSNTGSILQDMYDLSVGRAGFSPALGKTWYDLTGEKTLMIQTAVGGSPIEAWMKPEGNVRNTYGNTAANFYETTLNAYNHCVELIEAEDSGYELNRVYAYWLQGETGMASSYNPNKLGAGIGDWDFGSKTNILSAEEYLDIFMKNMEYFKNEMNVEFMGILLVRAMQEVCADESVQLQLLTDLVPARAAQYTLHNSNNREISLVSRVCDYARMESWSDRTDPGWGLIGSGNLHYNQTGHNANGVSAAENTYNILYGGEDREAYDIEIIDSNGRDRLEEGAQIDIAAGETYQLAAAVLPLYTDTPLLSYSVEDPSVCTVDEFGMLYAAADASGKQTVLTVCCEEAGLEKSIVIRVGRRVVTEVSYEWNFNNGDLTEKNGLNNLTVSQKTGSNAAYTIENGIYTSTNNLTNFAMEHSIVLTTDSDWCIEWCGVLQSNSALLGTAGNWTNFMYLAYSVPFGVENPMRIVGSDGTAIMISYGQYASYNTSGMNRWKVQYTASTGRVTLYLNNTIPVGTVEVPAGWSAEFTHLLGSYTTEANVDYYGSLDWLKVSTSSEEIVFD